VQNNLALSGGSLNLRAEGNRDIHVYRDVSIRQQWDRTQLAGSPLSDAGHT
jgi:hypothetical protein